MFDNESREIISNDCRSTDEVCLAHSIRILVEKPPCNSTQLTHAHSSISLDTNQNKNKTERKSHSEFRNWRKLNCTRRSSNDLFVTNFTHTYTKTNTKKPNGEKAAWARFKFIKKAKEKSIYVLLISYINGNITVFLCKRKQKLQITKQNKEKKKKKKNMPNTLTGDREKKLLNENWIV